MVSLGGGPRQSSGAKRPRDVLRERSGCTKAIERGVNYYLENLFDEADLPKPFSKAPRLTIYRRELYDYAECINIATLLRGRFPELDKKLPSVVNDLFARWQRPDGSFRSRHLLLGWDNVPMHRWAQAQLFRSFCSLLSQTKEKSKSECLLRAKPAATPVLS